MILEPYKLEIVGGFFQDKGSRYQINLKSENGKGVILMLRHREFKQLKKLINEIDLSNKFVARLTEDDIDEDCIMSTAEFPYLFNTKKDARDSLKEIGAKDDVVGAADYLRENYPEAFKSLSPPKGLKAGYIYLMDNSTSNPVTQKHIDMDCYFQNKRKKIVSPIGNSIAGEVMDVVEGGVWVRLS